MRFLIFAFSILISACSVYQSDGRKFLEKSAFEYAGVGAFVQSCGAEPRGEEWLEASRSDAAIVYISERSDYAMRVDLLEGPEASGCRFRFHSAQEMVERTEDAVEYTLLHLSLGEKSR